MLSSRAMRVYLLVVLSLLSCRGVLSWDEPAKKSVSGSLLICGGGQIPDDVLNRFGQLAGGKKGSVVVIPTAASDPTLARKIDYLAPMKKLGIANATVLHTRDREQANDPEFVAPLKDATAVWFVGGQQSRLADAYLGTAVELEIVALYKRGGVVGGISAGAAIQSRVMIQSGKQEPDIATGFDLLPRAIIDQHFLQRNRVNRLLAAVRAHPDRVGVGIDERTAILFRDGQAQVLGDSFVVVVSPATQSTPLSIHSYKQGEQIRFAELLPTSEPAK